MSTSNNGKDGLTLVPAGNDAPPPPVIPTAVCVRLAGLKAARDAAQSMASRAQLQAIEFDQRWMGEFASVLAMAGLDPAVNWSINFTTGELTRMPDMVV